MSTVTLLTTGFNDRIFGRRCRGRLVSKKDSFIVDQRGAAAFETIGVYFFLGMFLLLPLADVAVAGFQYISAWQALRAFGQYVQYNNPPDPTSPGTWASGLQKTISGYAIGNIQVTCGNTDAVCSNIALTPKYLTFSTTVTMAPMVLRSVLCPSSCTYTLLYSERFQ